MDPPAPLRRSNRRRCDVCGGRYISRGLCEFAPVCPRSSGRRREVDIPLAQQYWAALHDVIAAYGFAVTLWMAELISVPGLPSYRVLVACLQRAHRALVARLQRVQRRQ